MRSIIFTLLSILLISITGCSKIDENPEVPIEQSRSLKANITQPNAPNLDPNWDWNNSALNTVKVYYTTQAGSTINEHNMLVPWKTQGNPMNQINPDIKTEDGWILVYKDFGTPTRGVYMPYFAVYNKYRGILRVFVMNSQSIGTSYFLGSLKFRNSTYTNASLSFFSNANYLDSYDKTENQEVMATANQFGSWMNFDFNLMNYDPNVQANQILDLNIKSVLTSQIKLASTEFSAVPQYLSQITPSYENGVGKVLADGSKVVKGAEGLTSVLLDSKNLLEKLKTSQSQKDKSFLNKALGYGEIIPVVGKYLGISKGFFGGGGSAPSFDPIVKIEGTLKLDGSVVTSIPLHTISLSMKKEGNITPSYYQPVRDIKFGIFSLKTKILIGGKIDHYTGYNSGPFGDIEPYSWSNAIFTVNGDLLKTTNLQINPSIGLTLKSIRIKLTNPPDRLPSDELISLTSNTQLTCSTNDGFMSDRSGDLGLEFIFKRNDDPTSTKDLIFMKEFVAIENYEINEHNLD
ncbi:hypothetical protein [Sphingobacterium detergens]|uniref:Uncharacterized protein n=1 Tax=Sphingobacterium detergens TaxID=1145106 RepID=A0A420BLP8_SPHD1|nr:hypothetical protein [Sphingobacterium detergens]RKE57506.1 hypothetical protein DFQ12_2394 [Sphingobacterium detergens]